MFGNRIITQLLASLIAVHAMAVNGAPNTDELNKLLGAHDLIETSNRLTSDPKIRWPIIRSPEVENDKEKIQLAMALAKKIFEEQNSQEVEMLSALLKLSSTIERAGGYCNYVIADTINRLAAATITEAISKNEIQPGKALEYIPGKTFFPESEEWENLLNQEAIQLQSDIELKNAKPSKFLSVIYEATGNDSVDNLYYQMGSGEITTSTLLQKRNIGALARRMAETETYWNAQIPALIFFLKSGGEVKKIDLNDVRQVREILDTSPRKFESPLLSLTRINALHIKRLYEDSLQPDDSKRMLLGYN